MHNRKSLKLYLFYFWLFAAQACYTDVIKQAKETVKTDGQKEYINESTTGGATEASYTSTVSDDNNLFCILLPTLHIPVFNIFKYAQFWL